MGPNMRGFILLCLACAVGAFHPHAVLPTGGARVTHRSSLSDVKCVMNAKRPGEPQLQPAEFQEFFTNVLDQVNARDKLRQQMLAEEASAPPPPGAKTLSRAAGTVGRRLETAGRRIGTAGQLAGRKIQRGTQTITQAVSSVDLQTSVAGPMGVLITVTNSLKVLLMKAIALFQSAFSLGYSKVATVFSGFVGLFAGAFLSWKKQVLGFIENIREERAAKKAAELAALEEAEKAEERRRRREEARIRNKQRWDFVKGVAVKGIEKATEASTAAGEQAKTVADSAQRMAPGLLVLGSAAAAVDLTDVALASAAGLLFTTSVVDLAVNEKKKAKEEKKIKDAVEQAALKVETTDVSQTSYLETLSTAQSETEAAKDEEFVPLGQKLKAEKSAKAVEESKKTDSQAERE